jgi:hypothetical protein
LTLKCQIFAHQGLKTKEIFCKEKITDFILQGRKPKFTIKVGTENIFYPEKTIMLGIEPKTFKKQYITKSFIHV